MIVGLKEATYFSNPFHGRFLLRSNEVYGRIRESRRLFNEAVREASLSLRKGDLQSVIAWSKIAAHFAFIRHPGFYRSPELEKLLIGAAERIQRNPPNISGCFHLKFNPKNSGKMHILHVITESYDTGGHSPFISRWIQNTHDNSVHSLVTTAQTVDLPAILVSSVKESGGWICSLEELSSNLVEQALLLRLLARSWTDIIVLLVHPFDPIPIVAFGIEGGPPIIFCNHADHSFWLGNCIADVIADYHDSGGELSAKRRGTSVSRILPIPLHKPSFKVIEDSRKELGLSNNEVVLLTIGRKEKFLPFNGYDFLETIIRILKRHPNTILIAIGPELHDKWHGASLSVGGRIKALGTLDRETLEKYYNSADLYVSSFPCGSGTSMLEAGMHNLPIIGLRIKDLPHISIDDDVAFKNLSVHASSIQEYLTTLDSMINNLEFFRQQAYQVRESIEREHCSPGWNIYLNALLQSLPLKHGVKDPQNLNDEIDLSDIYFEKLSSQMMSNELPEHSFCRLVRVYSRYLSKKAAFSSQAENLIEAFKKVDNLRRFRQFCLESKEFLFSVLS